MSALCRTYCSKFTQIAQENIIYTKLLCLTDDLMTIQQKLACKQAAAQRHVSLCVVAVQRESCSPASRPIPSALWQAQPRLYLFERNIYPQIRFQMLFYTVLGHVRTEKVNRSPI